MNNFYGYFKTTDNNGGKQLQTISQEYEETDFKAAVNDIKDFK
ncbi:hypothetical protein [Treponema denticola]|nr:hypothetical protein [Treponema denticola]